MPKMRILLINVHYGIGSTGKIVESIYDYLSKNGHEVFCIYGRKSSIKSNKRIIKRTFEFESKVHHFFSLINENIYGGMYFSTRRIIRYIKKVKPDIVHLHCLNGYFVNIYRLITFLKKAGINTVITNHAEFMYTANCSYTYECNNWINNQCLNCKKTKEFNKKYSLNRTHKNFLKMSKSFNGFKKLAITNVSPWLTSRARMSPIFKDASFNKTILNPISNTFFDSKPINNPYLSYKTDKNTKIVFFCTSYFQNKYKGGEFLLDLAKRCKNDNILFFVKSGADYSPNSLLDNVVFIENKENKYELTDYYYFADCSLMLSKAETFSMVVAESLACGTPVAGFYAGGPESIAINDYCFFVEHGNINSLRDNVKNIVTSTFNKAEIRSKAEEKYNQNKIVSEYFELYESLIKMEKNNE